MNFPSSVDSFENPSPTDKLNSPSHSGLHTQINVAVVALENFVLGRKIITVGKTAGCDYLCDGVSDDVQIQEALNAVNSAGGGTVLVKAGTYDLQNVLVVGDNTTFTGEGIGATILRVGNHVWENLTTNPNLPAGANAYLNAFILSRSDASGNGIGATVYGKRITIKDFTLNVNGQNQTINTGGVGGSYVCGGIKLYPVYLCTIDHVEVQNASWNGIALYGANSPFFALPASPNRITNCHVEAAGQGQTILDVTAGILSDGAGQMGTIVSHNTVFNCSNFLAGIMVEDGSVGKVSNNFIYNCYRGISLAAAPLTQVNDNVIYLTIEDAFNFSIDGRATIEGNCVYYPGRYGIKITGQTIFKNNTIFYAGASGIYIGGTSANVQGNTIVDPGQIVASTHRAGIIIDLDLGVNNGLIMNNHITDDNNISVNPAGVVTMQYGIRAIGTPTTVNNVNISNNLAKNAAITNIDLAAITAGANYFAVSNIN